MSTGCIKQKSERKRIVSDAIKHLEAALKILKKYPDPDRAPRQIEEACSLVYRADGPQYPDHPLPSDKKLRAEMLESNPEDVQHIGLLWLMEHYFS